jgi:hypothetical protein
MRSAITGPHRSRNLLLCKQFGGMSIATEVPLVAIPEQIRCKCRLALGAVARSADDEEKR